jgi:addiction module HigA family antidote
MSSTLDPIPPGEILLEEFLKPLGLTQNELARAIDVPAGRINDIVRNRRSITRDTAARLAIYFRTSPDLWVNLQARYDAKIAARELMPQLAKRIRQREASAA